MSSQINTKDSVKHSDPIPINTSLRGRTRSVSLSSSSSGTASEVHTPASPTGQRILIPSPGSSPILSYFLGQSPKASTFPFKRTFGPAPVFEEPENEVLATAHARRASAVVAGRFGQGLPSTLPDNRLERGAGLLRRLSLSNGGIAKPAESAPAPPSPPPNTAVSPTPQNTPFSRDTRPRRAATINTDSGRHRRAPSPMGERILKGHFDGFN
ncbi:hypothetical protein AX16_009121 [Volvariella volvacea WC 439]|nr:hypothetical protein AX16_009121 [Volvariella volvacea WC 439]